VYGADGTVRQAAIDAEQFSLALFICSYIFQGLALVDLARLVLTSSLRLRRNPWNGLTASWPLWQA